MENNYQLQTYLADNLVVGDILMVTGANCFGHVLGVSKKLQVFNKSGEEYEEIFTEINYEPGAKDDYYCQNKSGVINRKKFLSYFPDDKGRYLDKNEILLKSIYINSDFDTKMQIKRTYSDYNFGELVDKNSYDKKGKSFIQRFKMFTKRGKDIN